MKSRLNIFHLVPRVPRLSHGLHVKYFQEIHKDTVTYTVRDIKRDLNKLLLLHYNVQMYSVHILCTY